MHQKLIDQVRIKARQVSLDVHFWDETLQRGATFGQRISDAFQQIFAIGYEHVIAVGNDCPALSVVDICFTANAVQRGKMVLGPTNYGGVYILGLSYAHFQSKTFSALRWSTSQLKGDLEAYASRSGIAATILGQKNEINAGEDLDGALSHPTVKKDIRNSLIALIISFIKKKFSTTDFFYRIVLSRKTHLRGPPRFSATL